VIKGYSQVEGLNFDKTFTPITGLDSIWFYYSTFCDEFSKIMTDRFEMFMMGKLRFFSYFSNQET
jgi:hypothetical protein